MGRPKTEIRTVTNCIVFYIENNPSLAMKFAEYHIKNWNDMPCFRCGGLQGQNYFQVFFAEAKDKIDEFIEKNKKDTYDIKEVCQYKYY